MFQMIPSPALDPSAALLKLIGHIEGAYSPSSIRAYRSEMLEFIRFCEHHRFNALPASPDAVSQFLLEQLGRGLKFTSLRRKASSISAVHRLSNLPDPTQDAEVRIALRKIKRTVGMRLKQAYPINQDLLYRLLDVTTDNLRGLRDKALLLLAYDTLRRRGELVSLRIEDIEFLDDQGASVLLRKSKTDQYGAGQWIHLSIPTTRAVEDWISAAGLRSGFILRSIRSRDNVLESMSESRVNRTLKRLARMAQLTPTQIRQISGHSTRVGAAQDLLIAGASLPQIMVKGGWSKTDTVIRYIERVNPSLLASVDPRALIQAGPRRSFPS